MKHPRQNLSFKEKLEISKALDACCYNDDGYAHYTDGQSDATLAERFNVSKWIVENLRKEMIGNLPRTPTWVERIMELEHRISVLEGKVP